AVPCEVRDRAIDRAGPLEAQVAVPRRDGDPRDRGGRHAGCVHVQLLLADAVERPAVALDDNGPDDIAVERVGPAPVAHRAHTVTESHTRERPDHRSISPRRWAPRVCEISPECDASCVIIRQRIDWRVCSWTFPARSRGNSTGSISGVQRRNVALTM